MTRARWRLVFWARRTSGLVAIDYCWARDCVSLKSSYDIMPVQQLHLQDLSEELLLYILQVHYLKQSTCVCFTHRFIHFSLPTIQIYRI